MESTNKKSSYLGFIIWNIILVIYFGVIIMSMAPIPNIVLGVIPALIFAVFIKKFPKQIYKAAMIYGFVILALIFIVFLNFKLGIIHGLNYLFLAPLFAPYPLGAIVQMFIKIFSKE